MVEKVTKLLRLEPGLPDFSLYLQYTKIYQMTTKLPKAHRIGIFGLKRKATLIGSRVARWYFSKQKSQFG
jgi:hypothetical protein